MKNEIKQVIDLIKESNNIFIASHINPDGDNMGSSLALGLALKKMNKEVTVLKSDIIPERFDFLPGIDSVKKYNDSLGDIDLFIVLDCGDAERLGENKELLEKSNKVINIDHHISNPNFGDLNIVNSNAAATGELVYDLIDKLDMKMDKDIAENLYTAISTDTGSFKYESTTSNTHRIIANLLELGIDKNKINKHLYESMSFIKMQLFIKVLNTLEMFNDNQIAIIRVTKDILKETGASLEDTEGMISFINNLETVKVACMLKEKEKETIKISLRTKKGIDAAKICKHFDGGGHKRAAGCTIYNEVDQARDLLLKEIQKDMGI